MAAPANKGKQNTKKTGRASSGSGARKPASKSSSSAAAKAARDRESRRFWSYILFFFGVLELLLTFVPGDGLWNTLYNVNRGLFGSAVFLFAPMVIYVALMIASNTTKNTVVAKVVEGTVLMLLASGMSQILQVGAVEGSGFVKKLSGLYYDGLALRGGGLASAVIGWPLLAAFKKVGATIVILLVAFTFIMLLTDLTLPQLFKAISKPFVGGYNAVANDRLERAQRREEQDEPLPKLQPQRRRKAAPEPIIDPETYEERRRVDIARYFPEDEPAADVKPAEKKTRKKKTPEKPPVNIDNIDSEFDEATAPTDDLPWDLPPELFKEKQEAPEEEKQDSEAVKDIVKQALGSDIAASHTEELPPEPPLPEEPLAYEMPETVNIDSSGQTSIFEQEHKISPYVYPPLDILSYSDKTVDMELAQSEIEDKANRIIDTLLSFKIKTRLVNVSRGPTVTRFELQPAAGVRVDGIKKYISDIALSLAAESVRLEAPVPGKSCIGIEVPNDNKDIVSLRELIDSEEYRNAKSKLSFAVGKDIEGNIVIGDMAKMPHLLVAGTTGAGKSVFTNQIILSILYHASPDEVKMILIDPKVVEFSMLEKIPHLLIPVVSDPLKAAGALGWAVNEMEKRYNKFYANGVKNLEEFNDYINEEHRKPIDMQDPVLAKLEPMPQILIVIDEFADLMMVAGNEVEDAVLRLGQKARAAGIHMILATQSPRKDVITGLIKANIPSRVALMVASSTDSVVILNESGAEKLLGYGDLLYKPAGMKSPLRIQSGYPTNKEIKEIVKFLSSEHGSEFSEEIMAEVEENMPRPKEDKNSSAADEDNVIINPDDDLIDQAITIIVQTGNASTSFLQRKLRLGFGRAARIMDEIEERGIIGPQDGSKPRKVFITPEQWLEMQARR